MNQLTLDPQQTLQGTEEPIEIMRVSLLKLQAYFDCVPGWDLGCIQSLI
jgi:hypothetical protein